MRKRSSGGGVRVPWALPFQTPDQLRRVARSGAANGSGEPVTAPDRRKNRSRRRRDTTVAIISRSLARDNGHPARRHSWARVAALEIACPISLVQGGDKRPCFMSRPSSGLLERKMSFVPLAGHTDADILQETREIVRGLRIEPDVG